MTTSAEALLAERVEKAARAACAECYPGEDLEKKPGLLNLQRGTARAYLVGADVPALVEALAQIAGSVDYEPTPEEIRRVGREWFAGFNDARQRAAEIAVAALASGSSIPTPTTPKGAE